MFLFDGPDRKPLWARSRRLPVTAVRIVWGVGTGPTATASFDAALAEAGVHNYNLAAVTSIIPAGVPLSEAGTAPSLGAAGDRLPVVLARTTVEDGVGCAGIGWTRAGETGPGLVYEASGPDRGELEARIEQGLAAARELRDWEFTETGTRLLEATADGTPTTAVVLAVIGTATPLVGRSDPD